MGPLRRAMLLLCCLLAGRSSPAATSERPDGLVGELAQLALDADFGPRLSISPHRPCAPRLLAAPRRGSDCPAAGGGPLSPLVDIAQRAAEANRIRTDPDAVHATALIDLLADRGSGRSLERSIEWLQTAAAMDIGSSGPRADLAAAYLVRAERAPAPRDLLAALDVAEEALRLAPRNEAALFNRAMALDRLHLVEEAARGWREYLAVDSASTWAAEARSHLVRAGQVRRPPAAPGPRDPEVAFEAFAAADPQGARELGWCGTLGEWAGAVRAGDDAAAEGHLRRAEALGKTLEARPNGDASLADAVRAIRRATTSETEKLAHAHHEFSAGCRLQERVDYSRAAPHFGAAAADGSPALRSWARLHHARMLFLTGEASRGERIVREAAVVDSDRHPALAGSARHLLASVLLRQDRYEAGLAEARLAARLFARCGEAENEGASLYAVALAAFSLRDADAAYAAALGALERLKPYRDSYRLNNVLSSLAERVGADGFARAAVALHDEGVRVAERTGNPVYSVEARLIRARLLADAGDSPHAAADVAAARERMSEIADPGPRDWMAARLRMAAAVTSLRNDPARAAAALDSAAEYFTGIGAPIVAFPAVVEGAWAWLEAGDAARGAARLEEALARLEQRRDSIRMEPRRQAVFEVARAVVDRMVMLKLASGRTEEALDYMDRGRASLAPVGRADSGDAVGGFRGPPGETALEYALVGDTLLVWSVRGRRVELHRAVVDSERLARVVERLHRRLEAHADEAELLSDLSALYDRLVRPVEGSLGSPGAPVVVVADETLAAVPFAALYDTRRRRYLIEAHPLRFAASLREARRERLPARSAAPPLLVADPAFDGAAHPAFERLPAATAEVGEIAPLYPRSRALFGEKADGATLRAALGGTALLHYAGHAVFDDASPERSFLLLAPTPGSSAPATLTAGEIAQLDLRNVSLVILAACRTVRTGSGRAAGFAGLAGAFLAAGAGGAVGSLWEVDDRLTRPLMVEFHREYRESGDGPSALRTAQLRLLRSADAGLRSPAAWAGFRYVGR
jgi:CHAT domain-containing protein